VIFPEKLRIIGVLLKDCRMGNTVLKLKNSISKRKGQLAFSSSHIKTLEQISRE